jgi:hypothetical protein
MPKRKSDTVSPDMDAVSSIQRAWRLLFRFRRVKRFVRHQADAAIGVSSVTAKSTR